MSAAPALLQHDTKVSKTLRKARISPKVRDAIALMVNDGLSRADAAEKCGITDNWLYIALLKPECRALRNHLMQVFRESAASRSLARIDKLADVSTSESVKFESSKLLLALEGVQPVQRTENVHVHQHVIPGLTVVRAGWKAHDDQARVIDGQAHEVETPHQINMIGQPVPHPEAGNVPGQAINPPENPLAPAAKGRGGK